VTGATGFVGRELCRQLVANGYGVRGTCRRSVADLVAGTVAVALDGIGPNTHWKRALAGVDAVVHLAARVHVMRDTAPDPLASSATSIPMHRESRQAGSGRGRAPHGIRQQHQGEWRGHPRPAVFRAGSPCPPDPYGVSKWEAEQALQQIATETGLEVAIIARPWSMAPTWRQLPADAQADRQRNSAAACCRPQSAQPGEHLEPVRFPPALCHASRGGRPDLSYLRRRRSVDARPFPPTGGGIGQEAEAVRFSGKVARHGGQAAGTVGGRRATDGFAAGRFTQGARVVGLAAAGFRGRRLAADGGVVPPQTRSDRRATGRDCAMMRHAGLSGKASVAWLQMRRVVSSTGA